MNNGLENALLELARAVSKDDDISRRERLSELRRYELYFNGFQALFYDATQGSYRSLESEVYKDSSIGSADKYSKVFNVYRAYIESIIAAVTAGIPKTSFDPENPNDPVDVSTAKAFTNLSKLIDQHNTSIVLFLRFMFIMYTQGPVYLYNYFKRDKAFGMESSKSFDISESSVSVQMCADCGTPTDDIECSSCGGQDMISEDVPVPAVEVKEDFYEKGREIIEVYGSLNVKLPSWVTSQSQTPYIDLIAEFPVSLVKSLYPDKVGKIGPGGAIEEREAHRPIENFSIENDTVTVDRMWVRPWAYYMLSEDKQKLLAETYPDGAYIAYTDGLVLEAENEDLDAHWTITEHPLSNRIWFEPLSKGVMPVQQQLNESLSIIWETVEKGIPLMFVDGDAVNLKKFAESPAEIGNIYQMSLKSGESAGQKFHETRSATLPDEIPELLGILRELGEFIIGALPSVYGGSQKGGSGTFSEYERSRTSSMQRLGLHWTVGKVTWEKMKLKAVSEFALSMVTDQETLIVNNGDTPFAVPIRKVDMRGRVRGIVPQIDESLPTTWIDQAAQIRELMQNPSDAVNTFLYDINNVERMARTTGLNDWYIPGADQRAQQLREIAAILNGQPVQVNPLVDNPQIHTKVIQDWAISEMGLYHKDNNPQGYMNVMMHLQEHITMLQQQAPPTPPQTGDPNAQ